MRKLFILFTSVLLSIQYGYSQAGIPIIDTVYMDHIKTAQIYPVQRPIDHPVIPLGKDQLQISFDDMGEENLYYRYTVIHCDRYWVPSDIDYNEYISGFENVLLSKSDFSISTYQPYRHYEFLLPNKDMDLLISGNYLLVVYEEETGNVLFSKRFKVYESSLKVNLEIVRPVFGNRYRTGQQLKLTAHAEDLRLSNPKTNIEAAVSQNGKWYYEFISPPRSVAGSTLYWNYTDEPVFDGVREFRLMDLRTTNSRKLGIDSIRYALDTIRIHRELDYPRAGTVHHAVNDLDGTYFINNEDKTQDPRVSSQYVKAIFHLRHSKAETQDIYVIGGLTDWDFKPEGRMKWDESKQAYTTSMFLKQGVYAYLYATKDENGLPDFSLIEGNDFNTENSYEVFIYYKTITDRYDHLIGYLSYPQVRR